MAKMLSFCVDSVLSDSPAWQKYVNLTDESKVVNCDIIQSHRKMSDCLSAGCYQTLGGIPQGSG